MHSENGWKVGAKSSLIISTKYRSSIMGKGSFFKTTYLVIIVRAHIISYENEDKASINKNWKSIDWRMWGWSWPLLWGFFWHIKWFVPDEWCVVQRLAQIGHLTFMLVTLPTSSLTSMYLRKFILRIVASSTMRDSLRSNQRVRRNLGIYKVSRCNLLLLNVNK